MTAGPEAAGAAVTWDGLAAGMRTCTRCPELAATRTQVVVGAAPPGARLLVVGEAPGAQEDASGLPFVGRSGQLLDRLLVEGGGDRARTAVLNTLKCRPPGNRAPTRPETAHCRPWTAAQLALVGPSLVVTLGLSATRWFLPGKEPLGSLRGRVHEVPQPDGAALRVLPTYHPSAALRNGPQGEPLTLLRADLALAVRLTS